MISQGVQLTDIILFLYLTISLKIPIIIISHITPENTPESSPLPSKTDIPLTTNNKVKCKH